MSKWISVLAIGLMSILAVGCANISTPTGGKKDVTPPKLVAVVPADSSTSVSASKLELYFDEYITAGDASKEVEVAPILPVPAEVVVKGRKVTVKFPDSLLEANTTYRVSLGNLIKDVHEGNVFAGYTYTFSTGSYFDSLEVSGRVWNAATGLPDTQSVFVLLYDVATSDSAVVQKKPRYAVKADNNGMFRFGGLPARKFRIYGLKDENKNLTYDGGAELIAFANDVVEPSRKFEKGVELRLFREEVLHVGSDTAVSKSSGKGLKKKGMQTDTGFVMKVNVDTSDVNKRSFNAADSIKIGYPKGARVNVAGVTLQQVMDGKAVAITATKRVDSNRHLLIVKAAMKDDAKYKLTLDSATIADTNSRANAMTAFNFSTYREEEYGKIDLIVPEQYLGQNKGAQHLLLIKAGADTVGVITIEEATVKLRKLRPAVYTFYVIVDENGNGKWDSGNLFDKKQPEYVIASPASVDLRAGFDYITDFEPKTNNKNTSEPKNKPSVGKEDKK